MQKGGLADNLPENALLGKGEPLGPAPSDGMRKGIMGRVEPHEPAYPDEEDSESAKEELFSPTEDETSESEGNTSRQSDEEEVEESSNSLGEVSLKDEDVQDLVDQLLKIESEAAEAQEKLEEESLICVRNEVKAELGETLSGSELDAAVEAEITIYVEEWEECYEDLQEQSSLLQERLEDAGVSLPDLFKRIEKQAPEGCSTEAWKQRTHWAGHLPTQEVEFGIKQAEEELKIRHPTRSQRGKLVDEGASGFLQRKFAAEVGGDGAASSSKLEFPGDDLWSKVDDFLDDEEPPEAGNLMGTKKWAAVYLASTPEQAAQLGLALPGVNTVEEIGDWESERRSHFKAAFANEKERGLTDRQKNSLKKVREEDDVKRSRRIRVRPWKRLSNKHKVKILQESRDHPTRMKEIRQPEKSQGQKHVVSYNGESGRVSSKQFTNRRTDLIELFSDDEGRQEIAPIDGLGHVGTIDRNVTVTESKEVPRNNSLELGGSALDITSDLVKHAIAMPKTTWREGERHPDRKYELVQDAHVKIEENYLSVPQIAPMLGLNDLKKKRAYEDGCVQGGSDNEMTPKKCKSASSKDEAEGSPESKREETLQDLRSVRDETMQRSSLNVTTLYRTTVIIDSDGEREVEEVVTSNVDLTSSGHKSHLSEYAQHLGVEGQRNGNGCPEKNKHFKEDRSISPFVGDHGVINVENVTKISPGSDAKKRKWKPLPEKGKREFPCTACGTLLRKKDVSRHPKLAVGICRRCKKHYLSGPFRKDEDGSDSECSWCGEGGEVVCCGRCDKVFCQACITRNFGDAETLRIVTIDDWLCYICNPVPLSHFTQQLKQAEWEAAETDGHRIEAGACAQDTLVNIDQEEALRKSKKGKHRKNIRKVLDDDELEEKQKILLALEKERQERLEQWRSSAGMKLFSNPARRMTVSAEVPEIALQDNDRLINIARAENEAPVEIAPSLASVLKEHQKLGVRFMWENCIVSEQRVKEGGESFGCILAHSMGLGKTLQAITFIHTVLNRDLGLATALIVVPVNVLHNWRREFEIWQAEVTKPVLVYMLEDSNRENAKRASLLSQWKKDGGVMLIGYTAFRNLSLGKHVRDKATRDELCKALQNPGPDLLVCDEAHTIKNSKSDITQVLKQVKTRRRIALTGSPLQNNLMEYYCMVDFVREGFLGSPQVFKNRFQNPIENGQHADSTHRDVRLMKQRAHVLHKELKGFVQRMNMSVLKDELPPKCVYVISVRLSPLQRKLYTHYLQVHGLLQDTNEVMENKSRRKYLFHAYHALAKVWNHPDLLLLAEEERSKRKEESVDDVIAESDAEKLSDADVGADGKAKIPSSDDELKKKSSIEPNELEKPLWWKGVIPEDFCREDVEVSGKMVLLLRLLTMCSLKGDKALVFSQSLGTLGMIERFLERKLLLETNGTYWQRDKHWYRLDGSTPAADRLQMCERFNDPANTSVKCVLISTRAGCLGINLPAANRVIIVDGSWNPTHDMQALFRAWRLGQKKPVFAYRLLAHGTMEEKIYSRQVAKEGVAARVLDEQQVGRLFAGDDLEFLFRLEEDGDDVVIQESEKSLIIPVGTSLDQGDIGPSSASVATVLTTKSKLLAFTLPIDAPPRDDLMGNLLIEYRPRLVVGYHEHEPLLEHREEENLTTEEQKAAWESYTEGFHGGVIQNWSTVSIKTTSTHPSTVVTKTHAVGTSPVPCSPKDHAAILAERNVSVRTILVCATCMLLISWEDLQGSLQRNHLQLGR